MSEVFKTLIVDDDPTNVNLLQILLDKYCPNIEVVGQANNTKEFIDLLLRLQPEIILLDIDLGEEKNTLEILKEVYTKDIEIIITSSYSEYAIKAINQLHVSSYILKPINSVELTTAITLAEKKIQEKRKQFNFENSSICAEKIIGIPTTKNIEILEIKDILYLEADGKYTVFHLVNGVTKIVSKNLGCYEDILPKNLFFRIHHKYIVSIKKIINISRSDGNYCQLMNGKSLSIAKRRHEELRKYLRLN